MGRIKQRIARMQAIRHIDCTWSEMESYMYIYIYIYLFICMYIYIYLNILQLYHNTESLLMTTTNWRTSFNHHRVSPCNPMMMQTETVSPNLNTANPRRPPHFLPAHMYMYIYIYTYMICKYCTVSFTFV